jgi:imidazolonepropionase-like amidohydrolase
MKFYILLLSLISTSFYAQDLSPKNGVSTSISVYYVLKNATIIVSPIKTIKNGSILIKNNEIIEVGASVSAPKEAIVMDCGGKTIVPSFIETYSNVGMPEAPMPAGRRRGNEMLSSKKGAYYWNESIHPEVEASSLFQINEMANTELIKMGFGLAVTHVQDGIARGFASLVALGSSDATKQLILSNVASFYSFKTGTSKQSYPSSQMGSIALLRETFYDLQWYSKSTKEDGNLSLNALEHQVLSPMIFKVDDKWEIFRATKIGDEFNYPFVIVGSGDEYGAIKELKTIKNQLIIPINFPVAYEVQDPYIAKEIPLSDLKHWELAPSNPFLLKQNNIPFSISSNGNKSAETFWANLRKAMERGLTASDALNALTLEPAKLLKIEKDFGTLEKGKKASFTIFDKNPFEGEAKVMEAWILGEQQIFETTIEHDIRGKYNVSIENTQYPIEITGSIEKLQGKITNLKQTTDAVSGINKTDTLAIVPFIKLIGNDLTLQFNVNDKLGNGSVNLHGKVNSKLGIFEGDGTLPNGKWIKWSAIKNSKTEEVVPEKSTIKLDSTFKAKVWFPNMAYGFDSLPGKNILVIRNATIWTNEKEGILKNATIVTDKGKIVFVGTGAYATPLGAKEIDAKGKHITSGIIDEHSHIAISKGVNEGGQTITSEVNIGEVISPDDITIYRQLAGGVTAAQLLHGSANTIGGQSALIKLKWGYSPNEFLIPNAPKFIKCALGENVKQSNYGDHTRFPQTRMGVEQVFYDGFKRAIQYHEDWKAYNLDHKHAGIPPRKDLELEALWEILNNERFITCHSYVQSEIMMLMHVADSMGFKVNTFTHILEGYKVADKMAAHGAKASTFADWWAYKFEVNDAIPYNAKMMTDQGVIVCINSDDAEMGRRLNQEAAKGVKYGGMSEEEAWKMVTLNPAKTLRLDSKMGSLLIGKDADIVLWSDNPLSIEAKVELTVIDGEILFDAQKDALLQIRNQEEKARIITKMLASNESGDSKRSFSRRKRGHFHCDTVGEEVSEGVNGH